MNNPREGGVGPAGAAPGGQARIIFLAITFGAVLTVTTLAVLGTAEIVPRNLALPMTVVRVAGLLLLVAGFAVTGMLSGSIPPRKVDQDDGTWWRANSARAIVTWAMAEGLAVVGGVLYLLTGDVVLLVGLGGGGLVILGLNRPGRMMEG